MRRALLAALALAGCAEDVELLPGGDGAADLAGAGDAGPACGGLGPSVTLPSSGAPACAAALAQKLDRYVLCTCAPLALGAGLQTDSFDSTSSAGGFVRTSAAVGTNGDFSSTASVVLGGALWASGGGAQVSAHLDTRQSLRVGGPLTVQAADVLVGTDAYVNGAVSGTVRIDGTLHVPLGAVVSGPVMAGATVREPVAVAAPCGGCAGDFPDLAAALAAAAARNDDAAIGLAPGGLAPAPAALDLPCGTYYVDRIATSAELALAVHGRALLAVAGDIELGGPLAVTPDAGAELDVIVGGNLIVHGGHPIGDKDAPARVRFWIAKDVTLEARPFIGAALAAPAGAVTAADGLDLYGSLLARSFSAGGNVTLLHFDRALLAAGQPCGASPEPPVE